VTVTGTCARRPSPRSQAAKCSSAFITCLSQEQQPSGPNSLIRSLQPWADSGGKRQTRICQRKNESRRRAMPRKLGGGREKKRTAETKGRLYNCEEVLPPSPLLSQRAFSFRQIPDSKRVSAEFGPNLGRDWANRIILRRFSPSLRRGIQTRGMRNEGRAP
jgi:hypothetical protein